MNPQIFGAGQKSRFAAISAQERENVYVEWTDGKPGEADRGKAIFLGFPGLSLFGNYGAGPLRGWWVVPGQPYLYAVYGNTLYRIANDGSLTQIGTLLTSAGRVAMADNGAQLMLVDNPNGYIWQISGVSAATGQAAGTFAQILAAGFLGASDVSYVDNAFITVVPGTNPLTSQQWQQSNLADGTGWSGVAFSLADSVSDPLIKIKGFVGLAYLFGPESTEFWQNLGLSPFQFGRNPATTKMIGLAAVGSVAECSGIPLGGQTVDALGVLGQTHDGQVQPYLLTGMTYLPIGSPEAINAINGYGLVSDCLGSSYERDKHRFYQLAFPSAGVTWVYDTLSGVWSKRKSYTPAAGLGVWRGGLAVKFLGRTLFADVADGTVYVHDPAALTEWNNPLQAAQPLVRRMTSVQLFENDDVQVLDEFQMDVAEGLGGAAGQGSAPQMMLEISRDKGQTWSAPYAVSVGPMGAYKQRALWRRLGRARNTTVRVTLSDPVPFLCTGEKVTLRRGRAGRAA